MAEPALFRGVYTADRASALSGVPKSTLYYWAAHDVWEPSLRSERPKLWTYADILAVRLIYRLRHDKPSASATSMPEVRAALEAIDGQGRGILSEDVRILVDSGGQVFFTTSQGAWRRDQTVMEPTLDLLAEFPAGEGLGPNLVRPRPTLRIVPGKLAGEPHVEGTRIGSARVAALLRDGLDQDQILLLYPDLTSAAISDCRDLEVQLQANLAVA